MEGLKMQMTALNTKKINEALKQKGYRGWSFEYESSSKRYCLSIFDDHNPEDELVFFLHVFDPTNISHAVRVKKNGSENPVDKKHQFYVDAEKIVQKFVSDFVAS